MSGYALNDDLILAHRLADAARTAIQPFFRNGLDVTNKLSDGFDPVTQADRASETAMRQILEEERPDDGVIGEEFASRPSRNGRNWVLDPIDGTRAFITGLPSWMVLIALSVDHEPVLGVADQPFTRERFSGSSLGGLWRRDADQSVLRSRKTTQLDMAYISTTDPGLFEGAEISAFERVRAHSRLCRYGLDAYAYSMLALGGLDAVIESGLKPFDIQALIPIVRASGGVITDWRGGSAADGGQVVAAASAALHAEILEHLADAAV